MSALVAGSVTYTIQGRGILKEESGFKMASIKIAFGNSTLTYPTGGVPLSGLTSWGFPNLLDSLVFNDSANANGFVYKWDRTNNKLLIYNSRGATPAGTVAAPTFTGDALAAHGHVLYVSSGATDATGARINAATNSLAMNNAAASVASLASATGAGGIVQLSAGTPSGTNSAPAFTGTAIAAASLIEATTALAPAATTIYALVRGY